MAVTHVHLVGREESFQEVEKLVNSHILHGSESLCKLLRYLAEQTLNHSGASVKEYQIATEVFARPANFDPHLDATVRVQAGRLRMKLAEYYNSVGVEDPVVVELPKGSYALSFHLRATITARPSLRALESPESALTSATRVLSRWKLVALVLALLFAASLSVIAVLFIENRARSTQGRDQAPAAYQVFWKPFMSSREEPWVIFSNAAFIGRPETGMRYRNAAHDSSAVILDHYTGVGEVLAVHNLDIVFGELHQALRVKRGSLFSLDDAKNNDLIFIGSPSENLTLLEIPSTTEFVFKKVETGPQEGNVAIVNVHPAKGEAASYVLGPSNTSLAEDYAVVALVRGINPEHSELILAGTTTIGTQAAVEYVTRENYLSQLLKKMNVTQPNELKPFEAVIQVKVARGVPVESSVVALRILN